MLFETQDGGQNWQLVYTGGSLIPALSAVGSKVWMTVEMGSGSNLKYQTFVSNNPANSESALTNVYQSALFTPVSTKSLLGLDFDSASDGWAITQSQNSIQNILLHTVDGGKSWSTVKTPKDVWWGMITGVYFMNPKTGWLLEVGEPGAGQEPKAVFQTNDGGQTWNKLIGVHHIGASTTQGSLGSGGYATGIDFVDKTTGWLWEERGGIYQTADGGRTWQPNPIGRPEMFEAQSITFWTPSDGLALFRDNGQRRYVVEKTSDGGRTWSVVHAWPIE